MVGNVREWSFNAIGDQRFILGGGWNDAYYSGQSTTFTQPPLDRSATNGFRLAITRDEAIAAQRAQQPVPERDEIPIGDPVSDEEFDAIRRWYAYDEAAPLNATIEATEATRYWTRERITFDAAYGDERVILYLYLPRSGPSRYQTIVHWPGGGAQSLASVDQIRVQFDFALKNGRAVAFPVYKGTFDRRLPVRPSATTIAGRDLSIQQVKDLRRSIDYLESRGDIDAATLAYYGISWGAYHGPLALVVEPRLRVGIFNQVGLDEVRPPEVNVINFLPRVDVPVLQLNGEFDTIFTLETSAIPFFELLGTPAADKKHVVAPGGHFVPTPVIIGETLDWLDKYLGPPTS
jgi:pimeloyl-ACP methyl ester carboxylesterase